MDVDPAFLSACPRRLLEWEQDAEGRAIVLRPRFGRGRWGAKLAGWLHAGPYRIRLDEIGSLVWKAFDGNTTMSAVANRLRKAFGQRVEPAEELLLQFASQMHRARMIEF